MRIKSIEVKDILGMTLDSVIEEMKQLAAEHNAEEVYCKFNSYRISSNMTENEIYLKVLGRTKEEIDKI